MLAQPLVVLGSRSPRRKELLSHLVSPDRIITRAPKNSDEAEFHDLATWPQFEQRLREIVRAKSDDVLHQLAGLESGPEMDCPEVWVITADTTVVVTHPDGNLLSLGQPPTTPDWHDVVRRWFREYLGGKTHVVMTGICVTAWSKRYGVRAVAERQCKTQVTMRSDYEQWINWYLATCESQGKAGGYAVQGAGSLFITHIHGSYSNVVGLPLEETLDALRSIEPVNGFQ